MSDSICVCVCTAHLTSPSVKRYYYPVIYMITLCLVLFIKTLHSNYPPIILLPLPLLNLISTVRLSIILLSILLLRQHRAHLPHSLGRNSSVVRIHTSFSYIPVL